MFLAHHVHDNMVGAGLSAEVGIQVVQVECIDGEMITTPEEIVGYSPRPSSA